MLYERKGTLFRTFLALFVSLVWQVIAGASIIPLETSRSGFFASEGYDVTPDGSTVVGTISTLSDGVRAFRWRRNSGMLVLGQVGQSIPNDRFIASSISDNGEVVVGEAPDDRSGFRWTESAGFTFLPSPFGNTEGRANGVDAGGVFSIGRAVASTGDRFEAVIWSGTSLTANLGFLSGTTSSQALDISADGAVVVGYCNPNDHRAFRWTAESGMVSLGRITGGSFYSRAIGVSGDGGVVVGRARSSIGNEAFLWSSTTGMIGLGDLPEGAYSSAALATNFDGSAIVGYGSSASGQEAFIFIESTIQPLKEFLDGRGIDTSEWSHLQVANSIKDDGLGGFWITGKGINDNTTNSEDAFLAHVENNVVVENLPVDVVWTGLKQANLSKDSVVGATYELRRSTTLDSASAPIVQSKTGTGAALMFSVDDTGNTSAKSFFWIVRQN